MKVYLAGGFHSGWQDVLIEAVPGYTYIDPRTHGLKDEIAYTDWDCKGIRGSDLVFAYFEADNPSGFGLVFEVGYARAFGKCIILVDELDKERGRYLGMVRASSFVVLKTFDEGIAFMKGMRNDTKMF